MNKYDQIAKDIKNDHSKIQKKSIFEPHFELIIELLKRGVRKNKILEYIKSIDENILIKNERTVQSLFSQFVNTKRIQDLLTTNIFISANTKIETKNLSANADKRGVDDLTKANRKIKEEVNIVVKEENKQKTAQVSKQSGELVAKTTEVILADDNGNSQLRSEEERLDAIRIKASKDPKSLTDEEREIFTKNAYKIRNQKETL